MVGERNKSILFSALMTLFILSLVCFFVSIISHIVMFVRTGSFQYLVVFAFIPVVYFIVRLLVTKKISFDDPDDYKADFVDTNTYIESCAMNWANRKSTNGIEYVDLITQYEDISNDLLRDIKWKDSWIERPDRNQEIMILDNLSGNMKIVKGTFKDIEKIGQPHLWMYYNDFKKYFIIKNYGDSDESVEYEDS